MNINGGNEQGKTNEMVRKMKRKAPSLCYLVHLSEVPEIWKSAKKEKWEPKRLGYLLGTLPP